MKKALITGILHSVKEFLIEAFAVVGLDHEPYLRINSEHFRPGEAVPLCGYASKARRLLGWQPTKTFEHIVEEMVSSDIERIEENQ